MPLGPVGMAATVYLYWYYWGMVELLGFWPFRDPSIATVDPRAPEAFLAVAHLLSVIHVLWIVLLALSLLERWLDRSRLRWTGWFTDTWLIFTMCGALLTSLDLADAIPRPGEPGSAEPFFEFQYRSDAAAWELAR